MMPSCNMCSNSFRAICSLSGVTTVAIKSTYTDECNCCYLYLHFKNPTSEKLKSYRGITLNSVISKVLSLRG